MHNAWCMVAVWLCPLARWHYYTTTRFVNSDIKVTMQCILHGPQFIADNRIAIKQVNK